jgi:2-oxoglutarate dehydrogenase E1 component
MSFIDNVSVDWLETQHRLWREAPEQLSGEWRAFFSGFDLAQEVPAGRECLDPQLALKQSGVQSLIYRYRDIGHLLACTDPLSPCKTGQPLLDLETFNLEPGDLDRIFHTRRFMKSSATLREILDVMQETYCRSIGVEFMHIQEPAERQWFIDRMEPSRNRTDFTRQEKFAILGKLLEAGLFEAFLHRRFVGHKRFSLEGGEALIPLLDFLVRDAAKEGVSDIILGMSHRGRLNVLANIFRKPYENIFAEFEDNIKHGVVGEGDVKYHMGFSIDLETGGKAIHLSLAFNPSHLEAVDPVVEGKCRARQDGYGPNAYRQVFPVLIHGDAAFAGQGIVAETLNMSRLEGYRTGGTLHIVLNNQIGFTTVPADARSTRYATDVAKMLMCPIFHVQGDDPEAVAHVARLALDYRQRFERDVVVEVICYRRYGHSEGDEPYFTQPLMYKKIKDRLPIHELYARRLMDEGVSGDMIQKMTEEVTARLNRAFGKKAPPTASGFGGKWDMFHHDYTPVKVESGVEGNILIDLAENLTLLPPGFNPHPKIAAMLEKRREAVLKGVGIDWGTSETLAYATLLSEGIPVRLSGQDSRRGAFNHRHSVIYDQNTGEQHVPLSGVARNGAVFRCYDSMLSEAAVLGFEYGYSVEAPDTLTIWEAQFGDFSNGAQVIIDQFVSGGEAKWERASGLVLFLPHGYEGQGAEHSSARIERYLQLCAEHNILVTLPSTPAQFFHLLRRQILQQFRKPLVIFTPKSLLRHPACVSRMEEFTNGRFHEILADKDDPEQARTLLLCSGKVYYNLLERKVNEDRRDIALVRIEQLYPLRIDLLRETLARYQKSAETRWVQEEPRNMGAWCFIRPYLAEILGKEPIYVGRPEAAAPAVGSHRQHEVEQARVIEEAFA